MVAGNLRTHVNRNLEETDSYKNLVTGNLRTHVNRNGDFVQFCCLYLMW